MRIFLFSGQTLSKLVLPNKIDGSFWLTNDLNDSNLVSVEGVSGKWVMKSNEDVKIICDERQVESVELFPQQSLILDCNGNKFFVFVENIYDNSTCFLQPKDSSWITLGVDSSCDIVYENKYLFNDYLKLNYSEGKWFVASAPNTMIYINNVLLSESNKKLNVGDVIFVFGIRIILYNGMISVNNPANNLKLNGDKFNLLNLKNTFNFNEQVDNSDSIKEIDYYKEDNYFYKKARLRRFIDTYEMTVATPPAKTKKEEMPALLVLGPMLTMALISGTTLFNTVSSIMAGEMKQNTAITRLISSGGMLLTSLLWPNLTKAYQKKVNKRKERERVRKYRQYISGKKQELQEVVKNQTQILQDNFISVAECENIILNKKINLWERRSDQKDFLAVRVGVGNVPVDLKLNFASDEFVMEEDELKKNAEKTLTDLKTLWNVPVSYSFNNKKVTAIMGANLNEVSVFIDNLLLQLVTFHSYDDLKIIFMTNKTNLGLWEKYKGLPHCFSNNKQVRFYANDVDEIKEVSYFLEEEYINRITNNSQESVQNETKEKTYAPYYLIITDDYPMIRKTGIVEKILKIKENFGFGLVCVENRLSRIPSECINFISVNDKSSAILCTDIEKYSQQLFELELNNNIKVDDCVRMLSNVPIEFTEDVRYLPTAFGFLEMFNVGKVEQLNSHNRWRMNDPIKSLRACIGVNDEGNPIYLDLHEKFHGPHGLIAGTTGSGKSEFIITYILSLAVNYSPNEVAFILIDYKGGGLAGAFENKTLGLRLPHLAGTITNLDKSELNRTLVSIESELKRRQQKFNEERDKLGESTIDIYKYQKFFREGKIKDPMPHLFIISDEFAELKSQQPEFMDDLISAARIGRSLGIHLILATQKPSGVVNDQIWSNTKFRVCLKVQDRADSNEMLKQPDAASITNAGRFYLQVGNNEIFVLGQSGWAGTQYTASDTVKKKYDRSISVIDDVGNVVKNLSDTNEKKTSSSSGDELSNVLKYICNLAAKDNIRAKNLWLDSMAPVSYVDDIIKKYNYTAPEVVTAVLGEYDVPSKQHQDILTLPLDEDANTIIYGASGTNRENFISTFMYSLSANYTAEDVNVYLADFGSESLRLYGKLPVVGDIIYASEEDKLSKMFALIGETIAERKKLFADYNGEYKTYCKNSNKKVPLKVFIINNYDTFKENHSQYEELIIKYSREGERYGVIFMLTAANSRSIFSKMEINFNHIFVLDMPDKSAYIDVLGKIGNILPAEHDGRGLIKGEEIYEFQTAFVCDVDNLLEFINNKVVEFGNKSSAKAPNIPSLPEVVTFEHLDEHIKDITKLPLGISKKSLKCYTYNFFKTKANIISSVNVKNCINILKTIIYGVRKLNHMIVLIDTEQELASIGGMVNTYVDKNFENFILKFEDFLDKEIDGKNIKVLCIISGLEKFQDSLNEKKFNGFFKGIKTLDNINLIFVDASHKLKKVGFEPWFSSVTDNSSGIWVGSGFLDQTVLKSEGYADKYKQKISKQFAWILKDCETELVKVVGDDVEDEK
ncbi:MAG: type VII secretion protein EssC [Bacilli bacterium]|nr:type VII secretion protein EssC [Bacilli bacterium]